jgi:hypothetical protein
MWEQRGGWSTLHLDGHFQAHRSRHAHRCGHAHDNAPGSPQTLALTGTGTAPGASLAPSSLSFGSELAGCGVTPSIAVGPGSAVSANVTVTTTVRSVAVPRWRKLPQVGSGPGPWPLGGVLVLAVLAAGASVWKLAGNAGRRRSRWALSPVLICVLATLLAGMVMFALGCGGSSSTTTTPSGTPAGTYTITVTGTYTSGSITLTQNEALSLTVQ